MRIFIKVKTKAREEKVELVNDNNYVVLTKQAPERGKANLDIIRLVADHFKVPISMVEIVSGHSTSKKIINVQER